MKKFFFFLNLSLCCCSLAQAHAVALAPHQQKKIYVNKSSVKMMKNHFSIKTNKRWVTTKNLRSDDTGIYILKKDIIGREKDYDHLGLCEDCREFHTGGGNCGGGYGGGGDLGGDHW
jgi:hypothetical protein